MAFNSEQPVFVIGNDEDGKPASNGEQAMVLRTVGERERNGVTQMHYRVRYTAAAGHLAQADFAEDELTAV